MTKHSPGPFGASAALSSDPYNIRYITDAEGNMLAAVRSGFSHCNPDPFGQDTALANAALFKAAPKMLTALEDMLNPIYQSAGRVDTARQEAARRAIAEAKGEK